MDGRRRAPQAIAAADAHVPALRRGARARPALLPRVRPRLPQVAGRLPSLRRRWMRRLGLVPGRLGLGLAPDAASSRQRARRARSSLTRHATTSKRRDVSPRRRRSPSPEPTAVPTATTPRDGRHLDPPDGARADDHGAGQAGRARRTGASRGRRTRTAGRSCSSRIRRRTAARSALATADKAARSGLHQVGILDSSRYASLQPGYLVVFTGIYGCEADADAAVATARQAGFGGAYSRQIAR